MAETVYEWADGVNKRVLRDGADWQETSGFIEDETRSGKRKRRLYATQSKREFSLKMRFSLAEYNLFRSWYVGTLKYGFHSFSFPQVDSVEKKTMKTYRFTSDGAPKYSNPDGKIIEASMKWEEQ